MVKKIIRTVFQHTRDALRPWYAKEFGTPRDAIWVWISWVAVALNLFSLIVWAQRLTGLAGNGLATFINQQYPRIFMIAVLARAIPAGLQRDGNGRRRSAFGKALLIFLSGVVIQLFASTAVIFLEKAGAQDFTAYLNNFFAISAFLYLLLLAVSQRHTLSRLWRVMVMAITAGNLAVLFSFYIIFGLAFNQMVPGSDYPVAIFQPYLNIGLFLAVFLVFAVGPISALMFHPRNLWQRAAIGAICGALVGLVLFCALISPLCSIIYQSPLYPFAVPGGAGGSAPDRSLALSYAVANTYMATVSFFYGTLLVCAGIGLLSAALLYLPRKKTTPVGAAAPAAEPASGPATPLWILTLLAVASPGLTFGSTLSIVILALLGPAIEKIFYTYSILPPAIYEAITYYSSLPGMIGWAVIGLAAVYFLGKWPYDKAPASTRLAALVALLAGALEPVNLLAFYILNRRFAASPIGSAIILLSLLLCVELLRIGWRLWKQAPPPPDPSTEIPPAQLEADEFLSGAGFLAGLLAGLPFVVLASFVLGVILIAVVLIVPVIGNQSPMGTSEQFRSVIWVVLSTAPFALFAAALVQSAIGMAFSWCITPRTHIRWDQLTRRIDGLSSRAWHWLRAVIGRWPGRWPLRVRQVLPVLLLLALLAWLVWMSWASLGILLLFLLAMRRLSGRDWITRVPRAVLGACFLGAFVCFVAIYARSVLPFLASLLAYTALSSVFLILCAICLMAIYRYLPSGKASIMRVGMLALIAVSAGLLSYTSGERIDLYGGVSSYEQASNGAAAGSINVANNSLLSQAINIKFFKDGQDAIWFKGQLGTLAALEEETLHIYSTKSLNATGSLDSSDHEALQKAWLGSFAQENPAAQDARGRIWAVFGKQLVLFGSQGGQSEPEFRTPGQRSSGEAGQSQPADCQATGFSLIDPVSTQAQFTFDFNSSATPSAAQGAFAVFSPDGQRVLSQYSVPRLWDASHPMDTRPTDALVTPLISFGSADSGIVGETFSPDGRYALTRTASMVRVWDLEKKQVLRSFSIGEAESKSSYDSNSHFNDAIFWHNGTAILTTTDTRVEVWDLASPRHVSFPWPDDSVVVAKTGVLEDWFFSNARDTDQIVYSDSDTDTHHVFYLYHQNEQPAAHFKLSFFKDNGSAQLIGISRDGKRLLFRSGFQLALTDTQGALLAPVREFPSEHLFFSPDGNSVVLIPGDGALQILDDQLNLIQTIPGPNLPKQMQQAAAAGVSPQVERTVAFNPVNGQIATLTEGSAEIALRDAKGSLLKTLPSGMDQPLTVAFSPDGKRLLAYGCVSSSHYALFAPTQDITSLAAAPGDSLWAGTAGDGAYQIDTAAVVENTHWQHFTTTNSGLPSDNVALALAGRQGRVWFGTDRGLAQYDGQAITTLDITGLGRGAAIKALYEDSLGNLWVGAEGRAARWDGQQWTVFNEAAGWPAGSTARRFLEDAQGNLWAGTSQGAYRFDGQDWQNLIPAIHQVTAMAETAGSLWIGGEDGLVRYNLLTGNQEIFNTSSYPALRSNHIIDLVADRDGRLWISTFHFTTRPESPIFPVLILTTFVLFGALYFKVFQGYQNDLLICTRKAARQIARQPAGVITNLYQLLDQDPAAPEILRLMAGDPAHHLPESLRNCIESVVQILNPSSLQQIPAAALPEPEPGDTQEKYQGALEKYQHALEALSAQANHAPGLARLYQVLSQAAEARSPQQIAAWAGTRLMKDSVSGQHMLAGEQFEPSALPGFLKADTPDTLEHLIQTATLMNKAQRVESSDRLSYLVGAMSAVENAALCAARASLPERAALGQITDAWRKIIHAEINQLSNRAELVIEFLTLQARLEPEITIALRVRNTGEALAENVCITLQPGAGFSPVNGEVHLERLSAKDYRPVEFILQPRVEDQLHLEVAVRWDDREASGKVRVLPTSIQLYRVEQAFRPIPNPYSAGRPVKSARMFHGREDVFTFIMENFAETAEAHTLVLHGQRRTGKTSILYQLLNGRLGERFIPVLVDMQEVGMEARSNAYLFYEITIRVLEQAQRSGIELAEPPREDFEHSVTQTFNRFLDALEEQLGPRKIVLMLDEFEVLEEKIHSGKLDVDLLGYFRSLIQKRDSLVFIFVGTHRLEEMSHDYWSILFNIALYREISFLKPEEARKLICEPVSGSLDVDVLAVEKIIALTHCHPYFTQLICLELVNYCNRCQRNYATINDVNEVTNGILSHGEAHFAYIWQQASSEERAVMAAIGQLLQPGREWAEPGEIASLLAANNYTFADPSMLIRVLDRLVRMGILLASKNGNLRYRFLIDLLGLWISRNQSLRAFVEREK